MNRTGLNNNFEFNSTIIRMLIMLVIVFVIVAFLVPGVLGFGIDFILFIFILPKLLGNLKAKSKIRKLEKSVKLDNPYLYFRELPNNYGIGVCTVLMDSFIENEKDIVAVILDLCARGYLHLDKTGDNYILKVIKGIDDNLVSNEKYIMSLILYDNLKSINYKEWFSYCMQDGINLDLIVKKENNYNDEYSEKLKNKVDKDSKKFYSRRDGISILGTIITILSGIVVIYFSIKNKVFDFTGFDGLFELFINYGIPVVLGFCTSLVMYMIISFVETIFLSRVNLRLMKNQNKLETYNSKMLGYMGPTEKGKEEIRKLIAFKKFIQDFGAFASKNPEEVILWDYYLSYAQVFGLTKSILSTGYDKLVKNASFNIDSIDMVKLNNINIINEK